MEFTIFRDLSSIAFVRCISPVRGTQIYAEGAAFSVSSAIAKCRSEVIEREFHSSLPNSLKVLGIAAHPNSGNALENAWNESLETLFLEGLAEEKIFFGIPLLSGKKKLWLGRLDDRFVCLGFFPYGGAIAATQSISKNPLKAILKTWAEMRNINIYRPSIRTLSRYTKANRILGQDGLAALTIKIALQNNQPLDQKYSSHLVKKQKHYIAYFQKEII